MTDSFPFPAPAYRTRKVTALPQSDCCSALLSRRTGSGPQVPLAPECFNAQGDPASDPLWQEGLGELRVSAGEYLVLVAEADALEELHVGSLRRERAGNAFYLLLVLAQRGEVPAADDDLLLV